MTTAQQKKFFRNIAVAGVLLVATPAIADDTIDTAYEVEIANITVMELKHSTKITSGSYQASFRAKTKGMLNFFADTRLNISTNGRLKSGIPTPVTFDYEREKNNDTNKITLNWDGNGVADVARKFSADAMKRLKSALAEGSRDPLSILLEVGLHGDGKPCTGTHRSYDGRDVYDMTFETLSGPAEDGAIKCRVTSAAVAGRDFESALPGTVPPWSFTSVIKGMKADAMSQPIYVPTRITGKLEGRNFTARLRFISINGQRLEL